jgi:hypothetical protein
LQLGQRKVGLAGDLRLNIGDDLRRHAAGGPRTVPNPLRLAGLAPLTHHLARPAMADSEIERNLPQTVRATVVRGKKLPPQIIIEGSRHSFRVARESLNIVYTIDENDLAAQARSPAP